MQIWRQAWRVRRATLARAVLVVRDVKGRVLVLSSSKPLRLPSIEVHAWDAITTQVEDGLQRLAHASAPSLIAVDGSPGPNGVTFLYGATCEGNTPRDGHLWLDPDLAVSALTQADRQLLRHCITHQHDTPSGAY